MTFFVSICEDMPALLASGAVSEDSPYRGKIDGRSGAYVKYSPDRTKSMIVLTTIDGLEPLQELSYITVTTYEEIFGYRQQVVLDGVPQFGEPTVVTPEPYYQQVISHYVNGDPVYRVERIETPTTRTVTDEEGNTTEVPGRPIIEYVTTDVIEGYKQVPVYVNGDLVTPEPYYVPNPIMEEVPGSEELQALYRQVHDYTGAAEDGTFPSKLFAVPAGHSLDHIL